MSKERDGMLVMVKQPKGSKICGHCCVAMITGKPVEEVITVFGHTHGTRTKEVHKALKHFGYETDSRLIRFTNFSGLPEFGIVKITYDWRKNQGHWVVLKDQICYDPSGEISHWTTYHKSKGRITSFMNIKPISHE